MKQGTQIWFFGGIGWGGVCQMEGTLVYLWLIHIDIWQKPAQYWKVIILQLK